MDDSSEEGAPSTRDLNTAFLRAINDVPCMAPDRQPRFWPNDIVVRRRTSYEEVLAISYAHFRHELRRPGLAARLFGAPDEPLEMPSIRIFKFGRILTIHLPHGRPNVERRTPGVLVDRNGLFIEVPH